MVESLHGMVHKVLKSGVSAAVFFVHGWSFATRVTHEEDQ